MIIRPTQAGDIAALQTILDQTDLFPAEMLPDMLSDFLSEQDSDAQWLTAQQGATAIGFCYARPEPLTDGTWNMLAIAVQPAQQGEGCGAAIIAQLEQTLRQLGGRVLIADTSGTQAFSATRNFYSKNGYTKEARIRDFWGPRDDKIVFWKSLQAAE